MDIEHSQNYEEDGSPRKWLFYPDWRRLTDCPRPTLASTAETIQKSSLEKGANYGGQEEEKRRGGPKEEDSATGDQVGFEIETADIDPVLIVIEFENRGSEDQR